LILAAFPRVPSFTRTFTITVSPALKSGMSVRKIASGEGVERVFQTHSKMIESVTVKRRGDVRRAKLYYLRERAGKAARIKEKITRKAAQEKIAAQISTEEKTIEAEEKQEQPEAKAKQTETKKEEQQPTEETPKAKQEKKEEPKVETENKKDEDTATEKNAE